MSRCALAIVALAGLSLALLGCSPNPPTDGLFGCATGGCPASHPYCHTDELCYAAAETDGGPRPDAYTPDAPGALVPEFGRCTGPGQCAAGLDCVSGFCGDACAMGGPGCTAGRACAPMVIGQTMFACLVDCNPAGVTCPPGTSRRNAPGMMVCHCAP